MGFFGGTERVKILNPSQEALSGKLSNTVASNIGKGVDVYSGQIAPGANQNQQQAFQQAGGLLGSRVNDQAAIQQMLSGRGDIEGTNQFYQQSVLAPARQEFSDQLRGLDERYGNTWGQNGGHQRVVSDATARFGTGIGSVLGNLVYQDRNAAADRQIQGVQAQALSGQDQATRLAALSGIGSQERSILGQQNQEAYNKWLSGQDYMNPWLGAAQTALSPTFAIGNDPGAAAGISSLMTGVGSAVHPL